MVQNEIKHAVEEYFKEMLALDKDYVDNVTDSWIDDAECWFLAHNKDVTLEEGREFRQAVWKKFDEIYDEQFGTRDAILRQRANLQKLKMLRNDFKRDMKFFKKFSFYNEVVAGYFERLIEQMQMTIDIEDGKIESMR